MNSQFSASVFRINQKNIATKEEPTDPYRSIGEIESEGVELEAIGQLTDSLRMQAAYTYTDIRYKKSSPEEEGKRAVYAPRNMASARLSYDVKKRPAGRPDRRLRRALCQRDRQRSSEHPYATVIHHGGYGRGV